MNNFELYFRQMSRAKERYEARKERVDAIVSDVLMALGHGRNAIDDIWIYKETVGITYSWSCMGCGNSDSMELPIHLFTADDPKAAAIAYKQEQDSRKANADRQRKLAEFDRLKKELGV
jgi:hypothetical protein